MKKGQSNFVKVTSKRYGKALKGIRIYFEGRKPKQLKQDGSIQFGKHILELLRRQFGDNVRWIITPNTDNITKEYGIWRVRTSERFLGAMFKELFERSRDIKNDIVRRFFSTTFPSHFAAIQAAAYVPGTLSNLLHDDVARQLAKAPWGVIHSYSRLLMSSGLDLRVTDGAVTLMAEWSYETKTYARGLKSIMSKLVEEAVFAEIRGKVTYGVQEVRQAINGADGGECK